MVMVTEATTAITADMEDIEDQGKTTNLVILSLKLGVPPA